MGTKTPNQNETVENSIIEEANHSGAMVYVGTYAKYNEGSIAGQWVSLEGHDKETFTALCQSIHADEADPELMFQDFEGFPREYYGESGLSEQIWEWLELDEDDKETPIQAPQRAKLILQNSLQRRRTHSPRECHPGSSLIGKPPGIATYNTTLSATEPRMGPTGFLTAKFKEKLRSKGWGFFLPWNRWQKLAKSFRLSKNLDFGNLISGVSVSSLFAKN